MYHALVRIAGHWTSFGLHLPSSQWSEVFQTLKRAYGEKNVKPTFWVSEDRLDDVYAVRTRADLEVRLANQAQRLWDLNQLKDAGDDGKLNLSRGIGLLRQLTR